MEFGIRELIQFGTLLASLAGAFAVVKSQLSRVIQDITAMDKEISLINTRVDQVDADRAVIKHQNQIFGTILSPANLEKLNKDIAKLQTEMNVVHKNLDKLADMHNGKHPSVN